MAQATTFQTRRDENAFALARCRVAPARPPAPGLHRCHRSFKHSCEELLRTVTQEPRSTLAPGQFRRQENRTAAEQIPHPSPAHLPSSGNGPQSMTPFPPSEAVANDAARHRNGFGAASLF